MNFYKLLVLSGVLPRGSANERLLICPQTGAGRSSDPGSRFLSVVVPMSYLLTGARTWKNNDSLNSKAWKQSVKPA